MNTPIHPNQVVDGIKFIETSDPTYRSSSVFDQVSERGNSAQQRNNTGCQMLGDSASIAKLK